MIHVINVGGFLTLDDVDLAGRTVLLRVDANSPMDPDSRAFLDDTRLREALPTLQRLSGSAVVLMAHQSRPGKKDFTSTSGHAREFQRLLGRPVRFIDDIHGDRALEAIGALHPGQVLMLDNVRMDPQEMTSGDLGFEAMASTAFVQRLSSVVDVMVNDAFGCAHRNSPSITGFTDVLPCIAGLLMEREIRILKHTMKEPKRPCVAVLGGIKVDDSIRVADHMLRSGTADQVWLTGGVANLALEVSGVDVGAPTHEFLAKSLKDAYNPTIARIRTMLHDFRDRIMLPVDVAANVGNNRIEVPVRDLPVEAPLWDLGLESIRTLSRAIREAGTIILNGPAGVFEDRDFALGTVEMLNACAETDARVIVGGGHTATLVMRRNLEQSMEHVSTGGGACLEMLAGSVLPAVASLERSASIFHLRIEDRVPSRV